MIVHVVIARVPTPDMVEILSVWFAEQQAEHELVRLRRLSMKLPPLSSSGIVYERVESELR